MNYTWCDEMTINFVLLTQKSNNNITYGRTLQIRRYKVIHKHFGKHRQSYKQNVFFFLREKKTVSQMIYREEEEECRALSDSLALDKFNIFKAFVNITRKHELISFPLIFLFFFLHKIAFVICVYETCLFQAILLPKKKHTISVRLQSISCVGWYWQKKCSSNDKILNWWLAVEKSNGAKSKNYCH